MRDFIFGHKLSYFDGFNISIISCLISDKASALVIITAALIWATISVIGEYYER